MEINDIIFSHFEDDKGNKYHLNGWDCELGEISFGFNAGKLYFYIFVECGFDIDLKLIPFATTKKLK